MARHIALRLLGRSSVMTPMRPAAATDSPSVMLLERPFFHSGRKAFFFEKKKQKTFKRGL
jgi:hypothetical protein